ncbi:hypothetical protein KL916_002923 [Ogataea parapolymorpha]|nr:hypothetical protein KL916_002923 [Ogataea parapolymorpha]
MSKHKLTNPDLSETSSQTQSPSSRPSTQASREFGREILMKPSNSAPPKIIMPAGSDGTDGSSGVVLQKKRRVVRACDRCRKLKIKCSGDQPCIHCTVYSYECTYDQPSRTKKKAAASSVGPHSGTVASSQHSSLPANNVEMMARLTDRLKLYDDILHRLLPDIKLTDLNDNPKPINPMKLLTAMNRLREKSCDDSKSSSKAIAEEYESLPDVPVPPVPNVSKPAPPVTAVKAHESPSERSQFCGPHQGIDGSYESSMGKEIKIILPSREVALRLITKTWENASGPVYQQAATVPAAGVLCDGLRSVVPEERRADQRVEKWRAKPRNRVFRRRRLPLLHCCAKTDRHHRHARHVRHPDDCDAYNLFAVLG